MTNCFRHLREYPELRAEIKKGAKELMESIPELTLEEAYLRQASMLLNESITDRDTVNQSVYDLYVKTAAGKKAVKNESKKQDEQTKVSANSDKDNSLEDSATNEVKTLDNEPKKQDKPSTIQDQVQDSKAGVDTGVVAEKAHDKVEKDTSKPPKNEENVSDRIKQITKKLKEEKEASKDISQKEAKKFVSDFVFSSGSEDFKQIKTEAEKIFREKFNVSPSAVFYSGNMMSSGEFDRAIYDGIYRSIKVRGESLPVPVKETDVDRQMFRNAFSGTSFRPEERGDSQVRDYVVSMVNTYDRLSKLAETDDQKIALDFEFQAYKRRYIEKLNAYMSAHGRVMSTMITGPSNFPTTRNQKKIDSSDKRLNELVEFDEKAIKRIERNIKKAKGGDISELDEAKEKLSSREKAHATMKDANKIIRDKKLSDDDKVSKLKELGIKEPGELLQPDFAGRVGFASYALQNNNAEIKRLRQRVLELEKKELAKEQSSSGEIESSYVFDGGSVKLNYDADRVQIFYDEKPDEEVRTRLKSRGFRWSPKAGAWQRKITNAAISVTAELTGANLSGTRFSKSQEVNQRSTVEQVISWLPKRIQRKVGSVVEVVQSVDELPTHLQERGTALYHAAFHGSPHNFDKFSTENIDTGEGAQAYGFGLYFAGNKEVAEWYRDKLTGEPIKVINISKEDASTIINEIIKLKISDTTKKELNSRFLNSELELIKNKAIKSETISDLENLIYTIEEYVIGSGYYSAETNLLAQKILDIATPFINREVINNGKIYHVELAPKEDEYLLWDKPLSEQSEKIKGILKNSGVFDWFIKGNRTGKNLYIKSVSELSTFATSKLDSAITEFKEKNELNFSRVDEKLSAYLHSLGIRGIKYLDGSSRNKGEGNYNYVIFSDDDVSIVAKYSKALQGVEGLYDKQTDKTYLIADMLNKGNVLAVAQHELLHRALATDTKLKNQLANLNRRLQVQFNRAAKGKASEIENKAYKRVIDAETPVVDQLNEFAAYLVSEYNNKPDSLTGVIKRWIQDRIAAIRAALIRIGFVPKEITAADLNALAGYGLKSNVSPTNKESPVLASKAPNLSKGNNSSWRNQPGFEGLTNEQFETLGKIGSPPNAPLGNKLKDQFDKHRYLWREKLKQGIFDQYDSFKSILNDNRAWMMANISSTGGAVIESAIEFGMPFLDKSGAIDLNTKEKSLGQIFEPLGDEIDRFMMWIAGNRAQRLSKEDRERLFSGADIQNLIDLSKGQKDGESREALYQKVRADFEAMNNAFVKIGVDTGLVSKADASIWKEQGFYVPFYRLAEDMESAKGPASAGGLVKQQAYKKLKGADMQLNDLLSNTMMNWNHLVNASLKNQAATKALETAVNIGIAEEIQAKDKSKKSIFVRQDGKERWFEVSESQEGQLVLDSLNALNWNGLNNFAMKVMRKFKRALTVGVTASPEFKVANLLRDSIQAIAVSDMSTNIAKNLRDGFKYSAKNQDTKARMIAGGGAFGDSGYIHGADPDAIKLVIKKGMDRANILDTRNKFKVVWDAYQDFGARLENVNRMANFEQALEQGKDLLTANFEARDQLDFQRTGSFVSIRAMAQIIPFLNARLQGLNKLGRAMSDPKQRKQFNSVVGVYSAISILLYLAMKDDDDYKQAEHWERDTYHLIKVPGTDTMLRIPRPFEVGAIANILERGVEQLVDDKVHGKLFAERLQHALTQTLSIDIVPQAVKPINEVWANKSSFTGRDIESQAMKRLSPTERKKVWTSQTAIGLSKTMDAILWDEVVLSPIQIEHIVNGYLGWAGATVLSGIDMFARPLVGAPERPERTLHEMPVIGRFIRDNNSRNSRFITEFYDKQKELQMVFNDIKQYRENQEFDKASKKMDEYRNELRYRKLLNRTQKRLSDLNKRIVLITKSNISPEQKRTRIDRINAMRVDVARRVVDKLP